MAEKVETNFDEFKEIAHSWQIGWKPKAYTSFVQYLKKFKNDLYSGDSIKFEVGSWLEENNRLYEKGPSGPFT